MTKYLGIDYGLAHIGLSTAEAVLATPLVSISNDQNTLARLKEIVQNQQITHIVCGIPEGKLEPIIKKFSLDLSTTTGLPVTLHPETLSTQEAVAKLAQSGASRAKKLNDHVYAACLILEDYLEFAK